MDQRFFKLDKNYLLKEAQRASEDHLLVNLVERAVQFYNVIHNPLGLEDDTTLAIKAYRPLPPMEDFQLFYTKLAAIYRYFHGHTQLEFIWDGRSHLQYYEDEWKEFFVHETNKMFVNTPLLKIVLELTVFAKTLSNNNMLVYRLSSIIKEHFNVQVYKRKGLRAMKIA